MWPKYLPLATFAYNTFNTPNLGNDSTYELISGRKPRSLLNLDSTPDESLNKRLKYMHNLLLNFKSKEICYDK